MPILLSCKNSDDSLGCVMARKNLQLISWSDLFSLITLFLGYSLLREIPSSMSRSGIFEAAQVSFVSTSAVLLALWIAIVPIPYLGRQVGWNRLRILSAVTIGICLIIWQNWPGSRIFLTPVLLIGFISLFYFVFVQILSSMNSPRDEGPLRRSLLFILAAFILNVLFVDGLNIFLPNTLSLWHHLLNILLALIQFGFLFFFRSEISSIPKMDRNIPAVHWVAVGTLFGLQWAVFQNLSYLHHVTAWPTKLVYAYIIGVDVLVLLAVALWVPRQSMEVSLLRLGLFPAIFLLWLEILPALATLVILILGEVFAFEIFMWAFTNTSMRPLNSKSWRSSLIAYALGAAICFVTLVLDISKSSPVILVASYILAGAVDFHTGTRNSEEVRT